jgi:hypothetical protein
VVTELPLVLGICSMLPSFHTFFIATYFNRFGPSA